MELNLHLSNDLIEKYGIRKFGVRKGDIVRIVKGDSDKDEKLNIVGKEAKVVKVLRKERKIVVENVNVAKADGKMKPRKLDPSSLIIVKIELEDVKRKEKLSQLASLRNKVIEEEPEPASEKNEENKEEVEDKEEEIEGEEEDE
ncbi:MAG: 50S ribosomal protein L24 [Thermoplasmata archaeon]